MEAQHLSNFRLFFGATSPSRGRFLHRSLPLAARRMARGFIFSWGFTSRSVLLSLPEPGAAVRLLSYRATRMEATSVNSSRTMRRTSSSLRALLML